MACWLVGSLRRPALVCACLEGHFGLAPQEQPPVVEATDKRSSSSAAAVAEPSLAALEAICLADLCDCEPVGTCVTFAIAQPPLVIPALVCPVPPGASSSSLRISLLFSCLQPSVRARHDIERPWPSSRGGIRRPRQAAAIQHQCPGAHAAAVALRSGDA